MATKWCKKLEVALKRCSIVFQVHPWNSKFTWEKNSLIFTQIECFRTVTPVLIQPWLWNYAQSLIWHRRGALLFFKVINQISRSHWLKNRLFESNLSKITGLVSTIKSLRFALFCEEFTKYIHGKCQVCLSLLSLNNILPLSLMYYTLYCVVLYLDLSKVECFHGQNMMFQIC